MRSPALLGLLLIAACAGAPSVQTATNPAASFVHDHTFSIVT